MGRKPLKGSVVVLAAFVVALVPVATDPARADEQPTHYEYPPATALAGSRTETLAGTRNVDGTCAWAPFPPMELGPGAGALTTREVAADLADCTTTVEIGVPPESSSGAAAPLDSTTFTGGINQDGDCPYTGPQRYYLGPSGPIPAYSATGCWLGSGYFRVNWFDIVNIKVNEVTNNVSFIVDGACVTDLGGWAEGYWLHTSGWRNTYGSYRIEPLGAGVCADTLSLISDADYVNPTFCTVIFNVFAAPSHTEYKNMKATVHRVNYLGGQVETDNEGGQLCPPLHHEEHLTRTW